MFLKLVLLFCIILIFSPMIAYADDDENNVAKDLGWIAVIAGIAANIPFIVLNKTRRYMLKSSSSSAKIGRQIGSIHKPILNFHIMLNSIGYFAGMIHGLFLSQNLDSISLSMALVMTTLMISGLALKYTSTRNLKIFGRLLHSQFGLVILLAMLVTLHIVVADD
jgi:hypothetical protein